MGSTSAVLVELPGAGTESLSLRTLSPWLLRPHLATAVVLAPNQLTVETDIRMPSGGHLNAKYTPP